MPQIENLISIQKLALLAGTIWALCFSEKNSCGLTSRIFRELGLLKESDCGPERCTMWP